MSRQVSDSSSLVPLKRHPWTGLFDHLIRSRLEVIHGHSNNKLVSPGPQLPTDPVVRHWHRHSSLRAVVTPCPDRGIIPIVSQSPTLCLKLHLNVIQGVIAPLDPSAGSASLSFDLRQHIPLSGLASSPYQYYIRHPVRLAPESWPSSYKGCLFGPLLASQLSKDIQHLFRSALTSYSGAVSRPPFRSVPTSSNPFRLFSNPHPLVKPSPT